jgi:sulfonate transport system substrate-binding protein
VKCIVAGRKEIQDVAIRNPEIRNHGQWAVARGAAGRSPAWPAFQFRGSGSAKAKTVTIAGIAYPFEGRQVYNGLTGVVIRRAGSRMRWPSAASQLAFTPVPTAVGAPLINEGFSGKRIDFAAYGDFPAIIAVSGGVPLKLVAPMGQGQNSYLVVRNGLAAKSSPI